MPFVYVQIRGGDAVSGPDGTAEEVKADLDKIRNTLGTGNTPQVEWLAAQGKDIVSADIRESN